MFGLKSSTSPSDPWPLKFKRHNFGARCHRTLRCSVIYDQFQFVSDSAMHSPSGDPPSENWKKHWTAGYIAGDHFAGPVEVDWVSLDGDEHHADVDLEALFGDRLVRHQVAREEIPEGWLAAWGVEPLGVHILMQIDDRTINVFMRALIITKEPQIAGNPRSTSRHDLILAWTHTY